ncbi:MAG TPA: carboxypeptidase regulatory-like domain-containing protein [Blastocatellia bacterium]|nr:carboxypeptidase regulatory-like domain-containing protein [Blastocatellia bacterium]
MLQNLRALVCMLLLAACCLALGTTRTLAQAQASTGQISGAVRDSAGAAVPNATVKVKNTQTGLERTATTSDEGLYRVVLLPPGTYVVSAEASGFAKSEVSGVTVAVGQITDANLTLGASGITEALTVTAEAVQTTASQPDALINETAINNLPINGRRFQDFVTLTPTAQVDPQRGQISLSGQRGINSNINIDGVDYNQPFFGGIRGGERSNTAFTIPQESIKEFQVVAAGYSAEFGRSTGGLVTAVTKSGTNQYHGSAFYLIRHRELSRNNDFYKALEANLNREVIAAPTQQQFGGSFGGPIRKDRAFFFGSYEQQRVRNPRQVFFDNIATFTPTPATQEAFDFYKSLQQPFEQTNDAKAGLVRIDYSFSDAHRFNVRYSQSINEALNANATGNQLFPTTVSALSNNGTEKDRTYSVVGQLTDFFAANLVNELRAQYSREVRPRLANVESPNVTNNIGRFGTVNFLPTTQFDWRVQVFNNLTWILGNHSVKFGAEINHTFADQTFAFNQFGVFSISGTNNTTILDILSYTPTITTGTTVNRFDSSAVTYLRQIGNGRLDLTMNEFALFVQDSWRIRPNFTLNYGLRWEGQFNPSPEANNDTLVNKVRGFRFPSGHVVDPTFIPDNADQFGPRLGIAWDPFKDNKTVIRAFSGIYYARTPMLLFAAPLNNFRTPPGDLSIQLPLSTSSLPTGNPNKSCTTVYCQFKLIGIDLNTTPLNKLPVLTVQQVQSVASALGLANFDPFTGAAPITWANDYKNPRSYQFGGGIEREIGGGLSVGIDYSQVNTMHLQRNRDLNLPVPVLRSTTVDPAQRPFYGVRSGSNPLQSRPIPSLGSVQVRESTGRSVYQAMTVRANLRRKRVQFNAFYTLSRSLSDDDNERDAGGVSFENAYNLKPEFNYSRLDRRHQFVANPVVFLPYGFEVSSALRLRSALPVDVGFGSDANGDLGGPDRPYSAPGVPFKRNAFRNLPVRDIDLRVQKSISFAEDRRLVFSVEFFNLPNLKNIQLAGSRVTNFCASPVPADCGFSAPTNVDFLKTKDSSGNFILTNNPGAPFQVQFGARFQF